MQQVRDNVTAYIVEQWGRNSNGFDVNIASPKMDTCKTIVSDVQPLATGIYCQQDRKNPPGPYAEGQWCTELWFDIEAVKSPLMEKRWKPILDFDPYRGWLYMYPTTDLNDFISTDDRKG
ncbi:MAG: hypothetical protein Q9223_001399 [Gallowayella weberi]